MNKALFTSNTDEWSTPQDFYDELDKEFGFSLDPCCLPSSAKCKNFFTPEENGLEQDWSEHVVFMNPPYGAGIKAWMAKACEEWKKGATVVCLVPARTDTQWWWRHVMDHGHEVRFVEGRLRFGGSTASAPFPSAIIVMGPSKEEQLARKAFNAGMSFAIGSHKEFKQTHPDFKEWWRAQRES